MADTKLSDLPVSTSGFTSDDKILVVEGTGSNLTTRIIQLDGSSVLLGEQFTDAQSRKLGGIADNANVGITGLTEGNAITITSSSTNREIAVSADSIGTDELDSATEARLTPDPSSGTDGQVLKIMNGAWVIGDDETGGTSTPTPTPTPTAMLSDFRLTSTPESSGRIDATASLVGQRFITFNARNHDSIHTLELEINNIRVGSWSGTALTEGTQSRAYTVLQNAWNQIIAANATELTFTLEAQDTDGNVLDSETLIVHRADTHPVTDEHGYAFASSSDEPDSIPSSAVRWDATGNSWTSPNLSVEVSNGDYFILLVPEDSDATSAVETSNNIESLSTFTRTTTSINSISYVQYSGQNNSGVDGTYNYIVRRSA